MLILLRDRQTILLLFLMPVALIFFMSLAMEGVWTDKLTGRKIQMVVENESHSPKANLLEEKIKSNKLIQHVDRPQGMDNDQIIADGKAQAVVTIPKGFEEGDKPVEIYFDPVMDAGYKIAARSLITSLTVEVVMGIDNLDTVVAGLLVEKTKPNREFPSPLQQTVPAYAIFAMFFIAIPMSIGFLKEKKDGTLQRLFTYPVNTNLVDTGENYSLLSDQYFPICFNAAGRCLCDVPFYQLVFSSGRASLAYDAGYTGCCRRHDRFWRAGCGAGANAGAVFNTGRNGRRTDGRIRRHHGAACGYAAVDEKTGDDFADVLGASGVSGYFFARCVIWRYFAQINCVDSICRNLLLYCWKESSMDLEKAYQELNVSSGRI